MATKKKTGKRAVKKAAANKAKGKRYTAEEKTKIVAFVEQVNAEKGRGGITAASAKYKVTPLTISAWLRGAGLPTRGGQVLGPAGPEVFQRLAELHEAIVQAEDALAEMRREYAALKRKL